MKVASILARMMNSEAALDIALEQLERLDLAGRIASWADWLWLDPRQTANDAALGLSLTRPMLYDPVKAALDNDNDEPLSSVEISVAKQGFLSELT
eukprot:scaffold82176_cov28-Prasinocladus_malaysianus.AAC.1